MTVTLILSLRDRPRGPLPLRVRRMTLMMTRSPSAEGVPEVCGRTWWRDSRTLRSGGWWRPCSPSPQVWVGMLWASGDASLTWVTRRAEDSRETGVVPQDSRVILPSPGFSLVELFVYFLFSALNISWWRKSSQEERGYWRSPLAGTLFLLKNWVYTCIFNNVCRRNGIIEKIKGVQITPVCFLLVLILVSVWFANTHNMLFYAQHIVRQLASRHFQF